MMCPLPFHEIRHMRSLECGGDTEDILTRLVEVWFRIAAVAGALGLWAAAQKDLEGTIAAFKRALALGGSRILPELFQAAGLPFDFGPSRMTELMEEAARVPGIIGG